MIQVVTHRLHRLIDRWPALIPGALAAGSAAVLAAALVAEHGFGLEPCALCLYQRVPYAATGTLGLAGLALTSRRGALMAIAGLSAVAFAAGAAIAGFHVGVEQHWWPGLDSCSVGGGDAPTDIADLRAMIEGTERVVPCDEVAWDMFGISMAGYNFMLSIGLVLGAGWGAWAITRPAPGPIRETGHAPALTEQPT